MLTHCFPWCRKLIKMKESSRLEGKVIVITGAAGLLGVQHALAVLNAGGSVVLLDVEISKLNDTFSHEILNDRALILRCDITDSLAIDAVIDQVKRKYGTVDGLVNNAAINPSVEKNTQNFTRAEKISYEKWKLELDVGLYGAFLCTVKFGNLMLENQTPGSVVNVASDHGVIAPNQNLYTVDGVADSDQPVKPVTYSVVKHGLIGMSKYFATYWASKGIRVNSLSPGGVENGQPEIFVERFKSLVPMGRLAKPNEYRGALIFLLSADSTYMTGANLIVDGGRSIW